MSSVGNGDKWLCLFQIVIVYQNEPVNATHRYLTFIYLLTTFTCFFFFLLPSLTSDFRGCMPCVIVSSEKQVKNFSKFLHSEKRSRKTTQSFTRLGIFSLRLLQLRGVLGHQGACLARPCNLSWWSPLRMRRKKQLLPLRAKERL